MRRFLIFVLVLLASTAFSASLAACRQVPAQYPKGEGGSPSLWASPSSSPTPTPTPTETPTPTATATPTLEVVFVPEGFQIGELGLLQNPETGKNVLAMNPEADWERVRNGIIGGLWQVNVDWANYTGQGNDATKYTKEDFVKAALEGKVLKIGIPVRANIDWNNIDKDKYSFEYPARPTLLELKTVETKLDYIKIQILDPDAFKNYLGGKSWLEQDMEVFSPIGDPSLSVNYSDGAAHFSVDGNGELIFSVGSYYFKDIQLYPLEFWLGRFNSKKGIGSEADRAVTHFLGVTMAELEHFSAGELKITGIDGTIIKYVGIPRIQQDVLWEEWYLSPQLFIFGK